MTLSTDVHLSKTSSVGKEFVINIFGAYLVRLKTAAIFC